jgi:hypothetical protein
MSNLHVFVTELTRILNNWPEKASWAVSQIAMYTQVDSKLVTKWLSSALGKDLDLTDRLTLENGEEALDKLRALVDSGERIPGAGSDIAKNALAALEAARKKLAPLLQEKNWRQSYKNFSFFMGQHGQALPVEEKLECCAECLRLGLKANISNQELAGWLRQGVDTSLGDKTVRGVEEALDLIDAYGDQFHNGGNNSFLQELFKKISVVAKDHGIQDKVAASQKELMEAE